MIIRRFIRRKIVRPRRMVGGLGSWIVKRGCVVGVGKREGVGM